MTERKKPCHGQSQARMRLCWLWARTAMDKLITEPNFSATTHHNLHLTIATDLRLLPNMTRPRRVETVMTRLTAKIQFFIHCYFGRTRITMAFPRLRTNT